MLHQCAVTTNSAGEKEVLVIGGFTGTRPLDTVDVYNVDQNTWRVGNPLPFPNMEATIVQRDDLIILTGGFNLESGLLDTMVKYNTEDETWTTLEQTMDIGLEHHAAVVIDVTC